MNDISRHTDTGRYHSAAIALHWLIAVLIVGGFYLGWIMTDIPGFTPTKLKYFSWHKWIGVTVLMLAVARVLWRATHRAPALDSATPAWQKAAAHVVHGLLYLLMLAIPVSGYLYSSAAGIQVVYLGIVPLPTFIGPDPALKATLRTVHVLLNYTLLALVAMHVLAALKHQFVDRDGLLARMIPFLK
ncbi:MULTISPECIES: cytochrome b [Paraburkholderia]|uniref:Cytochrome b561 n=1 Tax=Paraburkholderia caledonica TaxID=134536 RepID=A0ABU1KY73_9BURK|nr:MULTISPECIES: cytochrome b [Paraburkholderia]MDR6375911.1 cytochrome b561 [Paraburkholderia caledonica]MDR7003796.1 cytochrome b561 [Paraburkholderia strydomiana]